MTSFDTSNYQPQKIPDVEITQDFQSLLKKMDETRSLGSHILEKKIQSLSKQLTNLAFQPKQGQPALATHHIHQKNISNSIKTLQKMKADLETAPTLDKSMKVILATSKYFEFFQLDDESSQFVENVKALHQQKENLTERVNQSNKRSSSTLNTPRSILQRVSQLSIVGRDSSLQKIERTFSSANKSQSSLQDVGTESQNLFEAIKQNSLKIENEMDRTTLTLQHEAATILEMQKLLKSVPQDITILQQTINTKLEEAKLEKQTAAKGLDKTQLEKTKLNKAQSGGKKPIATDISKKKEVESKIFQLNNQINRLDYKVARFEKIIFFLKHPQLTQKMLEEKNEELNRELQQIELKFSQFDKIRFVLRVWMKNPDPPKKQTLESIQTARQTIEDFIGPISHLDRKMLMSKGEIVASTLASQIRMHEDVVALKAKFEQKLQEKSQMSQELEAKNIFYMQNSLETLNRTLTELNNFNSLSKEQKRTVIQEKIDSLGNEINTLSTQSVNDTFLAQEVAHKKKALANYKEIQKSLDIPLKTKLLVSRLISETKKRKEILEKLYLPQIKDAALLTTKFQKLADLETAYNRWKEMPKPPTNLNPQKSSLEDIKKWQTDVDSQIMSDRQILGLQASPK
jgi:hypothetical protein